MKRFSLHICLVCALFFVLLTNLGEAQIILPVGKARGVRTNTTTFQQISGILTASDTTVQQALESLSASAISVLTSGADGDSTTTQSDSGFEFVTQEKTSLLTMLRGCDDNQILKWDETQDDWNCEADADGAGSGDNLKINTTAVTDPDFTDEAPIIPASGVGVKWQSDTAPAEDKVSGFIAMVTSGADADSSTVQSDSGLEKVAGAITLLRGCSDNQILKWDETGGQDDWNCEADGGTGDNVTVNSTGADTTANFLNGDIEWTLVDGGGGGPDDITGTYKADSVQVGADTNFNPGLYLILLGTDRLDVEGELFTDMYSFNWASYGTLTASGSTLQHKIASAVTVQRVSCSTDMGSAVIQFDERTETTPNTAGTDVMTSTLTCDTNMEATTTFDNAGLATDSLLNLDIDTITGTTRKIRAHVEVTIDD